MSKENQLNLAKQSLPQLKELLDRQKALLRNKRLLENLNDKGESIKNLHGKIEDEIKHRHDIENVQAAFSSLTLSNNEFLNDKHVGYVCSKDRPVEDSRYRPHRTLIHHEQRVAEKVPNKFVEITAAFEPKLLNETVKFIPLAESLAIQNEQAISIMEEKARRTLSNLHDIINNSESDDESAGVHNEVQKAEESDDED